MSDMTVAKTILEQLGGGTFLRMTGANGLTGADDSLSFKVPNAANKINRVTITLNGQDLYDVDFWRLWGTKITEISRHEGIYFDMLRELFTEETKLYLTLR